MTNRVLERAKLRIKAKYGRMDVKHLGFVRNLSAHGLCLEGQRVLPALSPVNLRLFPTDIPEFGMKGEIRWVREARYADLRSVMGVKLQGRSSQYVDLIKTLADHNLEKREHSRFYDVLEIYIDPEDSNMKKYSRNISHGGLFMQTDEPFKQNSYVTLKIILADILETVFVDSRVVFELPPDEAARMGADPGNGFEFLEFYGDGFKILKEYIERLSNLSTLQ